jgi:hypothetical protein
MAAAFLFERLAGLSLNIKEEGFQVGLRYENL